MNNMTVAYIGLGSNIGSSKKALDVVIKVLANHRAFCMPVISSFYATSPVGDSDQQDFLNVVVKVDTSFTAKELLAFLLLVEKKIGRKRDASRPKGPRLIDCDLLLYGREQIEEERLVLPHPRMTERLFVMKPLVEIAPKAMIAGIGYAKEVHDENEKKGIYDSQVVEKLEE